ncbi:MAG: M23 family metallopeptidase [Myxococcales bacterium]|nr:MAG: M23 family metallopeptidase [Myxococcales bacterium]
MNGKLFLLRAVAFLKAAGRFKGPILGTFFGFVAATLIWGVKPGADGNVTPEAAVHTDAGEALASGSGPFGEEEGDVPQGGIAELPRYDDLAPEALSDEEEVPTPLESEGPLPQSGVEQIIKGKIERNESLSQSFIRLSIGNSMAFDVMEALKGVFDFRKAQVGNKWELRLNRLGQLDSFTFHFKPLESYYVRREGEQLQGYTIQGETTTYVVPVSGRINESLSKSVWKLGEGDQLTQMIAAIFAWDIDFYSDVQKDDEWRVLVEKHFYNGKFVKYGRILAAAYKGKQVGELYAYFFETEDRGRAEYFDDKGVSLQKSFLRAPLDTTRVSSKFGFRMHPTLRRWKQHNGVDYGAPSGTPIWAIAAGTVLQAGWMDACGKGVKLRHSSGYTSLYCHMSSVAVRAGQHMTQKQLVGRVGSTGRSTGPHLHFGLMKNGQYINPLSVKYEPGKPIEHKYLDRWKEARALLRGKLDAILVPDFLGPDLPPDWFDPTAPTPPAETISVKPKPAPAPKKGFRPRPEGIKRAPEKG